MTNRHQHGYTNRWAREAKAFLRLNPTCKRCGKRSEQVDHVIPHKGDQSLFWRRSNWMALCHPCHSVKTRSELGSKPMVMRRASRIAYDARGMPLSRKHHWNARP